MKVEIDRFGRVLIPKAIRERIGLAAGAQLEVSERDGVVLLEPVAESHLLTRDETGLLVLHARLDSNIDPIALSRESRSKEIR